MHHQNRPTVIVGIAVVENAGRFLVGTRAPATELPGFAEFPGGKCRPGETPSAAAARECLEETGIRVLAERLVLRTQYAYEHAEVDLHFYACRPLDVPAALPGGLRWVPRALLATCRFPAANAEVVKLLQAEDRGRPAE